MPLIEQIGSRPNLERAVRKVTGRSKAPGIDGETARQCQQRFHNNLDEIAHNFLARSYTPGPLRRVEIPKPNGKKRLLGIANYHDRVIQTAILQQIEPLWDLRALEAPLEKKLFSGYGFSPYSFAYRKGKRSSEAIRHMLELDQQGYTWVIETDLSAFFDNINRERLLSQLRERITCPTTLGYLARILHAKIIQRGRSVPTEKGVPQGAPLSPFLSNIYLDPLDRELERRGSHGYLRYADDFNVYVRSQSAAERVQRSLMSFIDRKLKLPVNKEKSRIVPITEHQFLGFQLEPIESGTIITVQEKKMKKFAQVVESIVEESKGGRADGLARLALYASGWWDYYVPVCLGEHGTFEEAHPQHQALLSRYERLVQAATESLEELQSVATP